MCFVVTIGSMRSLAGFFPFYLNRVIGVLSRRRGRGVPARGAMNAEFEIKGLNGILWEWYLSTKICFPGLSKYVIGWDDPWGTYCFNGNCIQFFSGQANLGPSLPLPEQTTFKLEKFSHILPIISTAGRHVIFVCNKYQPNTWLLPDKNLTWWLMPTCLSDIHMVCLYWCGNRTQWP